MSSTTTLIIYQEEKALTDVLKWSIDNEFVDVYQCPSDVTWHFTHGEEEIYIYPDSTVDLQNLDLRPDKVVFWGAFTKEFLRDMIYHFPGEWGGPQSID